MKKAVYLKLTPLLLLFSCMQHMQSPKLKNKEHQVFISASKMRILYVGITNPVEVIVPGLEDKDIYVTLDGPGELTRDTAYPHFYNVSSITVGKYEINVATKINGKITPLGSEEFHAKHIPKPVVWTTGNLQSGGVPVDKMKEQLGIKCMLINFDFDCHFSVMSYTMVFITDGKFFKAQTTGPVFSAEMKNYLNKAKPGDVIFFEDINVTESGNRTIKLDNVAYYLQ
jgi:hypothetical protein